MGTDTYRDTEESGPAGNPFLSQLHPSLGKIQLPPVPQPAKGDIPVLTPRAQGGENPLVICSDRRDKITNYTSLAAWAEGSWMQINWEMCICGVVLLPAGKVWLIFKLKKAELLHLNDLLKTLELLGVFLRK